MAFGAGTVDLRRYWNLLRRWWWLPLLGLLIGAGSGFLLSRQAAPVYRASAFLVINPVQNPGSPRPEDLTYAQNLAWSYSQVLRSQPVLDEVGRQLGFPLKSENIIVKPVPGTQILSVEVTDPDPAHAAAIANRLIDTLIQRTQDLQARSVQAVRQQVDQDLAEARQRVTVASNRLDQLRATPVASGESFAEALRLHDELLQYQETYRTLLEMQQRMRLEQLQAASLISVTNRADVPAITEPSNTVPTATMLRLGLIGLLLMVGLVVLIELLDDRVRDPEELRRRFNLVPLAVLAFVRDGQARLTVGSAPPRSDRLTEALRLLRTNLGFATEGQPTAVCISSALRNEGKSTVAANLAIAEARVGKRVILVDADLRDPILHHFFGLENNCGLSTVLEQTPRSAQPLLRDGPLGLKVLTSGPVPPNPTELLGSQHLVALIGALHAQADIVILDTAPILPFADTLALQRAVGGLVLVLDVQRTGTSTLERALVALERTPANVLGVVLNKDKQRRDTSGYDDRRSPSVRASVSAHPEAARSLTQTMHGD